MHHGSYRCLCESDSASDTNNTILKYCNTYFKLVFVVRFPNFHTPAVSTTHPARVNMNSTQPIPSPASKPVDEVDDAAK